MEVYTPQVTGYLDDKIYYDVSLGVFSKYEHAQKLLNDYKEDNKDVEIVKTIRHDVLDKVQVSLNESYIIE